MRLKALLASTVLVPACFTAALANPLGSQVTGGSATVKGEGTAQVTVTQTTDRAIINWNTFNLGRGDTTRFIQPNGSSVTLNRVTGNSGASFIDGTISANGRVFLVNPDGILFGANSRINVGGFLATTNDIRNDDFMAGRYQFNIAGRPDASVVNLGKITASSGGFAALVAPGVRNSGTITANLGVVSLAAGNQFTLDLYGDRLITLGVNDTVAAKVIDVGTGLPLNALIKNEGKLKANGGRVELTAATARQVLDAVINTSGVIEANSVGTKNGMIVLGAETAATKTANAPTQTVKVSGKLSASGRRNGQTGGKVQITGENIALTNATVTATGKKGGGTVLIGGDLQGGNLQPWLTSLYGVKLESNPVPTATNLTVDAQSTIDVSALDNGNGGKAVTWSNGSTVFNGSMSARGGEAGGNGGFVEVSGKGSLSTTEMSTSLQAPRGRGGTILFDPADIIIDQAEASRIARILNVGGNVIEAASNSISVTSSILKTAGSDAFLGIYADNGITIGPNVVIGSSSGKLNVVLDPDATNANIFGASYYGFGGATFYSTVYQTVINLGDLPFNPTSAWDSPRPITRTGQEFSTLPSAVLTIDPTARIYLNGGTLTAHSNNYRITNSDYHWFSGPTSSFQAATAACVSAAPCFYFAWHGRVDGPSYAEVLNYTFGRVPATIPSGVLGSGAYVPNTATTTQSDPTAQSDKTISIPAKDLSVMQFGQENALTADDVKRQINKLHEQIVLIGETGGILASLPEAIDSILAWIVSRASEEVAQTQGGLEGIATRLTGKCDRSVGDCSPQYQAELSNQLKRMGL